MAEDMKSFGLTGDELFDMLSKKFKNVKKETKQPATLEVKEKGVDELNKQVGELAENVKETKAAMEELGKTSEKVSKQTQKAAKETGKAAKEIARAQQHLLKKKSIYKDLSKLDFSVKKNNKKSNIDDFSAVLPENFAGQKKQIERSIVSLQKSMEKYVDDVLDVKESYKKFNPKGKHSSSLYTTFDGDLFNQEEVDKNIEDFKKESKISEKTFKQYEKVIIGRERLYSALNTLKSKHDYSNADFYNTKQSQAMLKDLEQMVYIAKKIELLDAQLENGIGVKSKNAVKAYDFEVKATNHADKMINPDTIEKLYLDQFEQVKIAYDALISYILEGFDKGFGNVDTSGITDAMSAIGKSVKKEAHKISKEFKRASSYISESTVLEGKALTAWNNMNKTGAKGLRGDTQYHFVGQIANIERNGGTINKDKNAYKYYLQLLEENEELRQLADNIINFKPTSTPVQHIDPKKVDEELKKRKVLNDKIQRGKELGLDMSGFKFTESTEPEDIEAQTQAVSGLIDEYERASRLGVDTSKIERLTSGDVKDINARTEALREMNEEAVRASTVTPTTPDVDIKDNTKMSHKEKLDQVKELIKYQEKLARFSQLEEKNNLDDLDSKEEAEYFRLEETLIEIDSAIDDFRETYKGLKLELKDGTVITATADSLERLANVKPGNIKNISMEYTELYRLVSNLDTLLDDFDGGLVSYLGSNASNGDVSEIVSKVMELDEPIKELQKAYDITEQEATDFYNKIKLLDSNYWDEKGNVVADNSTISTYNEVAEFVQNRYRDMAITIRSAFEEAENVCIASGKTIADYIDNSDYWKAGVQNVIDAPVKTLPLKEETDVHVAPAESVEDHIEVKAKQRIQELSKTIEEQKEHNLKRTDVWSTILLGEDGGIKSKEEFRRQFEQMLKEVNDKMSKYANKLFSDNTLSSEELSQKYSKEYQRKFSEVFKYLDAGQAFGLIGYDEYFDKPNGVYKSEYDKFTHSGNKYMLGRDKLNDEDFSDYSILMDMRKELEALQRNGGQDYIDFLKEEKQLLQEIADIKSRNKDAGNVDAHTLTMDSEKAKQKSAALEEEVEKLEKIIQKYKELDTTENEYYHDSFSSIRIGDLETLQKNIEKDSVAYRNFEKIQRYDQEKIFDKATDKYFGKSKGLPKELEIYWEKLDDAILDGSITGEQAIEKFNQKAKELGVTFDEVSKKWVSITSANRESDVTSFLTTVSQLENYKNGDPQWVADYVDKIRAGEISLSDALDEYKNKLAEKMQEIAAEQERNRINAEQVQLFVNEIGNVDNLSSDKLEKYTEILNQISSGAFSAADGIKKFNDVIVDTSTTTELEERCNIEKARLEELLKADKENDAAIERIHKKQTSSRYLAREDYGNDRLFVYDKNKIETAKSFFGNGRFSSFNDYDLPIFKQAKVTQKAYNDSFKIIEKLISDAYKGEYGIGVNDADIDSLVDKYLGKYVNGIKGFKSKDVQEDFRDLIVRLASKFRVAIKEQADGEAIIDDIIKPLEEEAKKLYERKAYLAEEIDKQRFTISKAQEAYYLHKPSESQTTGDAEDITEEIDDVIEKVPKPTLPLNEESSGQLAFQIDGVKEASFAIENAQENIREEVKETNDVIEGQIDLFEHLEQKVKDQNEEIIGLQNKLGKKGKTSKGKEQKIDDLLKDVDYKNEESVDAKISELQPRYDAYFNGIEDFNNKINKYLYGSISKTETGKHGKKSVKYDAALPELWKQIKENYDSGNKALAAKYFETYKSRGGKQTAEKVSQEFADNLHEYLYDANQEIIALYNQKIDYIKENDYVVSAYQDVTNVKSSYEIDRKANQRERENAEKAYDKIYSVKDNTYDNNKSLSQVQLWERSNELLNKYIESINKFKTVKSQLETPGVDKSGLLKEFQQLSKENPEIARELIETFAMYKSSGGVENLTSDLTDLSFILEKIGQDSKYADTIQYIVDMCKSGFGTYNIPNIDALTEVFNSRKDERDAKRHIDSSPTIYEEQTGQLSFVEGLDKTNQLLEEESGQMALFEVQAEKATDTAIEGQMHLNDYIDQNIQGQMTLNDLLDQQSKRDQLFEQVKRRYSSVVDRPKSESEILDSADKMISDTEWYDSNYNRNKLNNLAGEIKQNKLLQEEYKEDADLLDALRQEAYLLKAEFIAMYDVMQAFNGMTDEDGKIISTGFSTMRKSNHELYSTLIEEAKQNQTKESMGSELSREIEEATQEVKELTQAEIEASEKAKEIGKAFGITKKAALKEIEEVILAYKQSDTSSLKTDENGFLISDDFDDELALFANAGTDITDVLNVISKHIKSSKADNEAYIESWKQVRKYISNSKIDISDGVRSEFGDDYSSMLSTIGRKNITTDGSGTDIITFLSEMNDQLGTTFDLTVSNQDAFRQLYDFLKNKPLDINIDTLPESIRGIVNQIFDGTYGKTNHEHVVPFIKHKKASPKIKNSKFGNRNAIGGLRQDYDEEDFEIIKPTGLEEFKKKRKFRLASLSEIPKLKKQEQQAYVETAEVAEKAAERIVQAEEKKHKAHIEASAAQENVGNSRKSVVNAEQLSMELLNRSENHIPSGYDSLMNVGKKDINQFLGNFSRDDKDVLGNEFGNYISEIYHRLDTTLSAEALNRVVDLVKNRITEFSQTLIDLYEGTISREEGVQKISSIIEERQAFIKQINDAREKKFAQTSHQTQESKENTAKVTQEEVKAIEDANAKEKKSAEETAVAVVEAEKMKQEAHRKYKIVKAPKVKGVLGGKQVDSVIPEVKQDPEKSFVSKKHGYVASAPKVKSTKGVKYLKQTLFESIFAKEVRQLWKKSNNIPFGMSEYLDDFKELDSYDRVFKEFFSGKISKEDAFAELQKDWERATEAMDAFWDVKKRIFVESNEFYEVPYGEFLDLYDSEDFKAIKSDLLQGVISIDEFEKKFKELISLKAELYKSIEDSNDKEEQDAEEANRKYKVVKAPKIKNASVDAEEKIAIKSEQGDRKKSVTYREGRTGRTIEVGETLNKKTGEFEPFTKTLTDMTKLENEAIKWTNKLALAQADLNKEMRKSEEGKDNNVIKAIKAQIKRYQEILGIIDRRAIELADEQDSPFNYDDYRNKVDTETKTYATELGVKTAKQIRAENAEAIKQDKKLDEIKSKYTKRLSSVNSSFKNLSEYTGVENAINTLVNPDDVTQVETAFNKLEKAINEFKQNVKSTASLDPVFSALKTQGNIDNVVEDYRLKLIELGFSAEETEEKIKNLVKIAAALKNVDLNSDDGMIQLGEFIHKFNKKKGRLDGYIKNTRASNRIDTSVEKAYKKLADTEDRYLTLTAKEKTGIITEEQIAELKELNAEREKAYKTTKKRTASTQEEIDAQQRYNDVLSGSDDILEKYIDKEQQLKSLLDMSSQMMSGFAADTSKQNIDGFDDLLTYYQSKINDLNNNLKNTKNPTAATFDKYKKDIANIRKELDSILIGNVNIEDAEDKMRDYLTSMGLAKDEIGKFDHENKTITATFEDQDKQIHNITLKYNELTKSINLVKNTTEGSKSFLTKFLGGLTNRFLSLAQYLSSFASFYDIINKLKQGVQVVRDFDAALTEMRKVSDESVESLRNFQNESFDVANSIGTTAKQIQNSAADFMRLGYSLKEASALAKDANIYANVGDMEVDEATEHMISSIQAWKSEFSNEIEASSAIIDRYNEIGNNFAISSAEIGSAMERSAAALKAGGNTLNESLGLITAGNIIQQDAETTAAALKILSLRIRGSKSELEEMGESTDDLASSSSKLREEIKALTGVDIMADENTYKSTAKIIEEIGAVWDKLSDVSQAATLEKLAGEQNCLKNMETYFYRTHLNARIA